MNSQSLLALLQLVSPALPVGAYTYSEGLETLMQMERLTASELENWLKQELHAGAIRVEATVLVWIYRAAADADIDEINRWNQWLSAFRETEEMRQQSWQMGRALARLLDGLQDDGSDGLPNGLRDSSQTQKLLHQCANPLNFVTAFAIAAQVWQIDEAFAVLGYLQSWAANLINAGVRLVPLGQTQGQQILLNLAVPVEAAATEALQLADRSHQSDRTNRPSDDLLECCSWGVSLASMNHETLYSRLFRS